ncbi:transcription factor bHLH71-like [Cucurbita maxima]|uniref:Transcription factor bHLH71-like n=1 Tax=Cucurbita maxima TaxID=3661 RepID=A0A6J1HQE1_CUCMA|nr:transcription factor bHLH71-like [Cucurbita maxima]
MMISRTREELYEAIQFCPSHVHLIYLFPFTLPFQQFLHLSSHSSLLSLSFFNTIPNQKPKKMSLDALSSNDFFNFIIYDTISAIPNTSLVFHDSSENTFFSDDTCSRHQDHQHGFEGCLKPNRKRRPSESESLRTAPTRQGKKKRKRKPRVSKNKEEAETQRMTHIAVERNRRKQMNEHLSVLRSLMPESYVQRGDQASIVGGAVEFVKELEHLLSTLEAKKLQVLQKEVDHQEQEINDNKLFSFGSLLMNNSDHNYCSQYSTKYTSKSKASSADIEVTLIETHANLRILSTRSHRQLLKLIAGLQALRLTILHLSLTDFHPVVLYSISLKVEEGCQLRSVDDIAAAAHHMVRIIEEETMLC